MKFHHLALAFLAPLLMAQGELGTSTLVGDVQVDTANIEFGPGEEKRTVHYQLELNERGRATACRILKSSGDALFDKSVCRELRKSARFNRATSQVFSGEPRFYNGIFYATPARLAP